MTDKIERAYQEALARWETMRQIYELRVRRWQARQIGSPDDPVTAKYAKRFTPAFGLLPHERERILGGPNG